MSERSLGCSSLSEVVARAQEKIFLGGKYFHGQFLPPSACNVNMIMLTLGTVSPSPELKLPDCEIRVLLAMAGKAAWTEDVQQTQAGVARTAGWHGITHLPSQHGGCCW